MNCLYCNARIATPRTKPRRFCADRCRAAWQRVRARVLAEAGVDSLIAAITNVFDLAMPGNGAETAEREAAQLVALVALASHRLVRHPWPLTLQEVQVSPDRLDLIPSSVPGGGPAPLPAVGGFISAEMPIAESNARV